MPVSIDKNDVDISKLFKWGGYFPIKDSKGETVVEVYIRLVGDAEINRARVYALRKSAELRRKLKDLDSDERIAFIPEIDVIEKEQLINGLSLFHTRRLAQEAAKNLDIPMKPEPDSEASLEEQEEYQEWVDNYPKLREEKIRDEVYKKLEDLEKEMNKSSKEDLYKTYINFTIENLCENEMMLKYREMTTYLGTYTDESCTSLYFKSFDEFENLSTGVKEQLSDFYLSLEVGGEDLKKLLDQMQ